MRLETLSDALPGENMIFCVTNMFVKDICCDNAAGDSKNGSSWLHCSGIILIQAISVLAPHWSWIATLLTLLVRFPGRRRLIAFLVNSGRWPKFLKSTHAAIFKGIHDKTMYTESFSEYPPLDHFAVHDMNQLLWLSSQQQARSLQELARSTDLLRKLRWLNGQNSALS